MQDNSPWNWHLEEVTFVEAAIELCARWNPVRRRAFLHMDRDRHSD
jgi:hypothetical protein